MTAHHHNPRPAGPPSTAPPIASPRPGGANMPGSRPAPPGSRPPDHPHKIISVAFLSLLLIISGIPPVAATDMYCDMYNRMITVGESG